MFHTIGVATVTIAGLIGLYLLFHIIRAGIIALDRCVWAIYGSDKFRWWNPKHIWGIFTWWLAALWEHLGVDIYSTSITVTSKNGGWYGFGNWYVMRGGIYYKRGWRFNKD